VCLRVREDYERIPRKRVFHRFDFNGKGQPFLGLPRKGAAEIGEIHPHKRKQPAAVRRRRKISLFISGKGKEVRKR